MRKDLELLLRPLEQAKHQRRRAALRSRFAAASLFMLFATSALVVHDGGQPVAAIALLLLGIAIIRYQLGRLARMPDPIPPEWLHLAVEARLSREGREALTQMLLAPATSCDTALDWARAELYRPLDCDPVCLPKCHLVDR